MPSIGRRMECSFCGHEEHLLRCEAQITPGVVCRCRDVRPCRVFGTLTSRKNP